MSYIQSTRSGLFNAPVLSGVTGSDLKDAMRQLASGVSVVTAGSGENISGATVTSATALSVEPPTIIVNINRNASVWPLINSHKHFCLNILSVDQRPIADRFAGRDNTKGAARYEGSQWYRLESGALALHGALASIDCAVEEIIERHSHAIIIGSPLKIITHSGEPLLYHNGDYRCLQD